MDGRTAAAVLGVAPGATKQELVRAFRARAKQAHPDGAGSDEAFLTLRAAYEHLLATVGHDLPAPQAVELTPVAGPRPGGQARSASRSWLTGSGRAAGALIDLTDSRAARTVDPTATAPLGAAGPGGARQFAEYLEAELARRPA